MAVSHDEFSDKLDRISKQYYKKLEIAFGKEGMNMLTIAACEDPSGNLNIFARHSNIDRLKEVLSTAMKSNKQLEALLMSIVMGHIQSKGFDETKN